MKHKMIYRIASLVMALVMILGTTIHTQAAPAAQTTSPSIYWGANLGEVPSSTNLQGVFNTFETRSRKKMAIIPWGQSWQMPDGSWGEFPTSYFNNVRNHGSIPMITWGSQRLGAGINQANFQLRDIYGGTHDTYIRRWATAAKNWGHPFFLRFEHEMNGWWYPWGEGKTSTGAIINGNSAGDFVKAWRHVHDIFTSVGATNVTWVWAPNHIGNSNRYPALSTLYPGDAYVDWTGFSVYNKYNTWLGLNPLLTGNGVTWLKNSYNIMVNVAPNKPMMLAEWASIEAGDGGAKKAAWIRDALITQIPGNLPKIKAVVWFNSDITGRTYPIESSQASIDAWATGIGAAKYAANQFASLRTSPIPPLGTSTTTASAAAEPVGDTSIDNANPQTLFSDVAADYWASNFIEQLYGAGITGGCSTSPLLYCPEDTVTRAQMAVFLERAIHGADYVPAEVGDTTGFDDVQPDHWAAPFIKQLVAEGITAGCGGSSYCPEEPVTQAQMAVFLLRSKYGASYMPPEVGDSTDFDDVQPDHWAAPFIKQLVAEGIAAGCSTGSYCPESPVTRAQMAVLLVRTFLTPR